MRGLVLNAQVIAQGGRLPLGQFQNKPRWMGFLNALLAESQELEYAIINSITGRYLPNAVGWALNQWGILVGAPRPSYGPASIDDNAYRALIYGQIAANTSYGTKPDLYNLLRAVQTVNPRIYNVYPAAIYVEYSGIPVIDEQAIKNMLIQATHPIEIDTTNYTDHPFGFEGDLDAYGFDDGEIANGA